MSYPTVADMTLKVTSIKGAKAAFSVPIGSFWPYKFVSQLAASMIERNAINLQTNTAVTSVSDGHGFLLIHTPRGTIRARKIVYATNAYTAGICGDYEGKIVPTLATATHITPSSPVSPHLSNTYNINFSPGRTDYLNPRPDGGIVVGGGQWCYSDDRSKWYNRWDDSKQIEEVKPHFTDYMQRNFKGWENSDAKMESIWTGVIGKTEDEMPHIGEVPGSNGRKFVIAGFNGGGMGMIFLCAKGLAKMVKDGSTYEQTGLPSLFKTTAERLM